MTWGDVGAYIVDHVKVIAATLGLGGGVGLLKFIRHIPPPPVASKWGGAFFDWSQDIAANNDRVGERIGPDGQAVFLVTKNPEKEQGK